MGPPNTLFMQSTAEMFQSLEVEYRAYKILLTLEVNSQATLYHHSLLSEPPFCPIVVLFLIDAHQVACGSLTSWFSSFILTLSSDPYVLPQALKQSV